MTPGPTVSVTIVLYNSEAGLAECLRALKPELEDGFAELIAVDNASPDRSADVVAELAPGAELIRANVNRGFSGGVNLAWPRVRGRYWLLLNPDVRLDHGALRRLVEWMNGRPQTGAASAELVTEGRETVAATGRAFPSLWRPLLEASRLHLLLPARVRGRLLRGAYWTGGDQEDVGWVPGTAVLVRRTTAESVGLLNERLFLYGEDIEWCWRVRRHGWRIGVCSDAVAFHQESGSADRTFGSAERNRRMVAGELEAVRLARGTSYARWYGSLTALALRLEAVQPRRSAERRRSALAAARLWRSTVREQLR